MSQTSKAKKFLIDKQKARDLSIKELTSQKLNYGTTKGQMGQRVHYTWTNLWILARPAERMSILAELKGQKWYVSRKRRSLSYTSRNASDLLDKFKGERIFFFQTYSKESLI